MKISKEEKCSAIAKINRDIEELMKIVKGQQVCFEIDEPESDEDLGSLPLKSMKEFEKLEDL